MKNPPFPYSVVITREVKSDDPFVTETKPEKVYDGKCDKQANNFPTIKNGVEYGKYKLYITPNDIIFKSGDLIELNQRGNIIKGKVSDYNPTNLGTTIYWDVINN